MCTAESEQSLCLGTEHEQSGNVVQQETQSELMSMRTLMDSLRGFAASCQLLQLLSSCSQWPVVELASPASEASGQQSI